MKFIDLGCFIQIAVQARNDNSQFVSKPFVNFWYLNPCIFKLYLTVAVSIASCERSFSKLKLINCYLRSIMGESRLSALGILSIESDFVEMLSFEDIISEFVSVKSRRIEF